MKKYSSKSWGFMTLLAVFMAVILSCLLSSCNLTRTISTQSEYFQRGDTTCTIVTKTIETYDATKKK